jgi:hypothetical protein
VRRTRFTVHLLPGRSVAPISTLRLRRDDTTTLAATSALARIDRSPPAKHGTRRLRRHPKAPRICNEWSARVSGSHGADVYVARDAGMTDSLIQTLVLGLIAALLGFELCLAVMSWVEAVSRGRTRHRTTLLITRPFAFRDHFRERRTHLDALRRQYPVLRLPDHGRRVRAAARLLQPTWLTPTLAACPDCRGSRMRGLGRCPSCARRLIEPAHAAA